MRSEKVATPGGHHDECGNAELHQFGIVAQSRSCPAAKNNPGLCHRAHGKTVSSQQVFLFGVIASKASSTEQRIACVLRRLSNVKQKSKAPIFCCCRALRLLPACSSSLTGWRTNWMNWTNRTSPVDQRNTDARERRRITFLPSIAGDWRV